ncbi:MAG TPA: protein kinase [Terriglobales bacterium]|nr:protein kinase [Terriglobales bacterium]
MITSGTKLGPYEIVGPLGAGGMGEVYRARDTRLGREVAIKVLPQHLSSNPDLKARFEREAKAISALNHAHICHLYDVGSQAGTDYLVMELLEGESLDKKLERGPLPLKQTLEVGVQIAEALEKAHKSGIVHRDLKPGNIVLTKEGAKLLDFGLAKPNLAAIGAIAGASSGKLTPSTPTMSVAALASPAGGLTQQGTIVGTFQYMAPECLQGQEADARSDLFSFGCVLYEMVTGKRAFPGKSQLSVLTAILEKDPEPITAARPLTPPALEHTVRRALVKDPDRRWQSAADLASELKWIAESPSSASLPLPAIPGHRGRRWTASIAAAAAALALGIVIGIVSRPQPQRRAIRTVVIPPEKTTPALIGDFAGPPVLSPDGAYLAFSATDAEGHSMLWLRPMNSLQARALPGTEGAIFPFWSPDSHSLAFFADKDLRTTDLNGGAPQAIAQVGSGRGGSWGAGGVILYAPDTQSPIMRVSASGGPPAPVTRIDQSLHTSHRWPFLLPDGKHFLYSAINHDPSKSANNGIYFASLDGRENRLLSKAMSNAIYANGYILFARDTQLMAQQLDPATGTLSGEPQRLTDGVANDLSTWHVAASASGNGLLALGTGGSADVELVWVDRTGKQLSVAANKLTNLQNMRISPQGDRLALQIDTGVNDIWVADLNRGVRTRLTFGESTFSSYPVWSPDGKSIVYSFVSPDARSSILYRRAADGSGAAELLYDGKHLDLPEDWSSDGKYLLFARTDSGLGSVGHEQTWALPVTGKGEPFFVAENGLVALPLGPRLSPNSRWLAYTSSESGQNEVFVISFPGGHGKWQISPAGGIAPFWRSDGKELFYLAGFTLMSVSVTESAGSLQFGPPQPLFTTAYAQNPHFDVAPDGKRFLVNRVAQQTNQPITIISNWTAELKK